MAENILETRILLRYATYQQWMNSNVILKQGEAAIAAFPRARVIDGLSNSQPDNTPPAIGIKIGDGVSYFSELPWVQAIAADVYQWAKSVNKPTYGASEISGLVDFIQQNAPSMPGDGTVAPRIYQIVQGTGANINHYYLRYIESTEEGEWVTDTQHYIDLDNYAAILDWIGADLENYGSLGSRTETHIQYDLGQINYDDSEREGYFVTAVSQNKAKISVTKKQLTASDISGVLSVEHGGTGLSEVENGEALIGNGTRAMRTLPIDTTLEENNHLVTAYAVKRYVDSATAGLESAMHYIGDSTVEILAANDPHIAGYNFATAKTGDVVTWDAKEYVWTGSRWRLLGDEGSYAIKGSIRDADIDSEANISQSKIYLLTETFDTKVDKEQGKGLSTNDYTTEEKQKLANIEDGAQVNVIEHIFLNDTEQQPHTVGAAANSIELNIKEFTDEAREKLAGIEEGANVNTIESIALNGTVQSPDQNKQVNLTINEFTAEDEAKLDSIEEGAQVNTIEHVFLNGAEVSPDQNKRLDLYVLALTQQQIDKLNGIEDGAQVNVIERVIYDGQEITPNNNKVLTIESNPHTEHENVIEHITLNGSEVYPDNNKTVALVVSGTLSQAQIDKLNGIEEHAEVNEIEGIQVNGVLQEPNNNRIVNLILNKNTLGITAIEGAEIPDGNEKEEVSVIQNKLQLARIAVTANVADLAQSANTYILLDCGTSLDVI